MSIETPDMEDLVTQSAQNETAKVNVAVPAFVTSYDEETQKATVQPVVRWRFNDPDGDAETELPAPVPSVPVHWPQAGGLALTFPIELGDWVLLVICDRSIDEWEATGAQDNTPQSQRRHDMIDAIAIPGVRPFSDPIADVPTDRLRLGDDTARLEVTVSHKIRIGNDNVDVVDVIHQLCTALGTSYVTVGAPGPTPLQYVGGDTSWSTLGPLLASLINQIKE